jgi:hypothetical protein
MWGMGSGSEDRGGRTDYGSLNDFFSEHPILAPVVGLVIAGGILALAYFLHNWRIAIGSVLLLVISVPLLIVGIVRLAIRRARGPIRCPKCGASEREAPGFTRLKLDWVSYKMVKCNHCGTEWVDRPEGESSDTDLRILKPPAKR